MRISDKTPRALGGVTTRTIIRTCTQVIGCIVMLFGALTVNALTLGKLQVDSNIGEPLRIQIRLDSVSSSERESLDVSLASRSDYARAGVEYPLIADQLEFELVEETEGSFVVEVYTLDPINETYLHLFVSAVWSGGKVVREYTALLDPPLYSGRPAKPISLADSNPPLASENLTESVPTSGETGSAGSVNPPQVVTPTTKNLDLSTESDYEIDAINTNIPADGVLVRKGDTLSGVIQKLNLPKSVTYFQALQALFDRNPSAFIDSNMNLVREGARLQIPSLDQMQAISRTESVTIYSEQLDKFLSYRNVVLQKQNEESNLVLDQLIDDLVIEQNQTEASPNRDG